MGPKSSEYFSNHCSHRHGMPMGDMLGLVISLTAGDFVFIGLQAVLDARNPRYGIGFCSRSEDTRDKSWLVVSSSLEATCDCAGSTLVEPTISHQVVNDGNRETILLRISAVSHGGSRCCPDQRVFILSTYFCSSSKDKACMPSPFTNTQQLPKSRHTPCAFMNGVPIMQSYQSMLMRSK